MQLLNGDMLHSGNCSENRGDSTVLVQFMQVVALPVVVQRQAWVNVTEDGQDQGGGGETRRTKRRLEGARGAVGGSRGRLRGSLVVPTLHGDDGVDATTVSFPNLLKEEKKEMRRREREEAGNKGAHARARPSSSC